MKKEKLILLLCTLLSAVCFSFGQPTVLRNSDSTYLNNRQTLALSLVVQELFNCDSASNELTAKVRIAQAERYVVQGRLDSCNEVSGQLEFDLNVSQSDNKKIKSENVELRADRKALLWGFIGSAALNVGMIYLFVIQ